MVSDSCESNVMPTLFRKLEPNPIADGPRKEQILFFISIGNFYTCIVGPSHLRQLLSILKAILLTQKKKLNNPWPKMLWHNCFRSINYSTKKKDALIILLGYDTIFDQKKRNDMILLMQIPRALRLLIKDTQFG